MTKELWALGARDLAGRIAAKEISSREVIGAHLARIETVNPAVNAVTVPLADQAMAAAAAADQAIAVGHSLGPGGFALCGSLSRSGCCEPGGCAGHRRRCRAAGWSGLSGCGAQPP